MFATAVPAHARQIPVPEGFRQLEDIARYQLWLEEAYRSAISTSVRGLIAEVVDELAIVSATGIEAGDEFAEVVQGAIRSVASALDHEVRILS